MLDDLGLDEPPQAAEEHRRVPRFASSSGDSTLFRTCLSHFPSVVFKQAGGRRSDFHNTECDSKIVCPRTADQGPAWLNGYT